MTLSELLSFLICENWYVFSEFALESGLISKNLNSTQKKHIAEHLKRKILQMITFLTLSFPISTIKCSKYSMSSALQLFIEILGSSFDAALT